MCTNTLSMNCMCKKNCHMFSVWTGKIQSLYIIIAIGAGVILLIPLIAVGAVKKW